MITTPAEFKRLRESKNPQEYQRAARDSAAEGVWEGVLRSYPEMAFWVAQNKTVPLHILLQLAQHEDSSVREMVARKRKIDRKIFDILKEDRAESVRYALLYSTKLSVAMKREITTKDPPWLETVRQALRL